jgi:hypothetical protein
VGNHIVVCPADPELLGRLRGCVVVLRLPSLEGLDRAIDAARRAETPLHCVAVESRHPLAMLKVEERWVDTPIALAVPSIGRIREVVAMAPLLRRMNIRIVLAADVPGNLTALRILASLGVACVAGPGKGPIAWDEFSELATYALVGIVPHAPIEPFDTLAAQYDPNRRTDLRRVWFDDVTRFVHMDGSGRFALTASDLAAGRYAGLTPEELDGFDATEAYRDRLEAWRLVFLQKDGCASCPGWRICLGTFESSASNGAGCRKAFSEILDLIEGRQTGNSKGSRTLWQV